MPLLPRDVIDDLAHKMACDEDGWPSMGPHGWPIAYLPAKAYLAGHPETTGAGYWCYECAREAFGGLPANEGFFAVVLDGDAADCTGVHCENCGTEIADAWCLNCGIDKGDWHDGDWWTHTSGDRNYCGHCVAMWVLNGWAEKHGYAKPHDDGRYARREGVGQVALFECLHGQVAWLGGFVSEAREASYRARALGVAA